MKNRFTCFFVFLTVCLRSRSDLPRPKDLYFVRINYRAGVPHHQRSFRVSKGSPIAPGGVFVGLSPLKQSSKFSQIEVRNTVNKVEFLSNFRLSSPPPNEDFLATVLSEVIDKSKHYSDGVTFPLTLSRTSLVQLSFHLLVTQERFSTNQI